MFSANASKRQTITMSLVNSKYSFVKILVALKQINKAINAAAR